MSDIPLVCRTSDDRFLQLQIFDHLLCSCCDLFPCKHSCLPISSAQLSSNRWPPHLAKSGFNVPTVDSENMAGCAITLRQSNKAIRHVARFNFFTNQIASKIIGL